MNKVVELSLLTATHHFSIQLLSLSAANWILYVAVVAYSFLDYITKSHAFYAALMPLGYSDTRSLMKSRNDVGDRAPPCGTPCLSWILLLWALQRLIPCSCRGRTWSCWTCCWQCRSSAVWQVAPPSRLYRTLSWGRSRILGPASVLGRRPLFLETDKWLDLLWSWDSLKASTWGLLVNGV